MPIKEDVPDDTCWNPLFDALRRNAPQTSGAVGRENGASHRPGSTNQWSTEAAVKERPTASPCVLSTSSRFGRLTRASIESSLCSPG
jgi:hypothetical protein